MMVASSCLTCEAGLSQVAALVPLFGPMLRPVSFGQLVVSGQHLYVVRQFL